MKRIIKITEAQLREAGENGFDDYDFTNGDSHPYNGQSAITPQGKLNGEENAESYITDRIGNELVSPWRFRMYGSLGLYNPYTTGSVCESNDTGNAGINPLITKIASMGQGKGVETLSNNNLNDDLCVIPQGIVQRCDNLIKLMQQYNLNPKQIAMVFDKFEEAFPQMAQNSEFIKSLLRQQIDPNSIKDPD